MLRLLFSTLIDKIRQLATVGCFTRKTSPFQRQCGEIHPADCRERREFTTDVRANAMEKFAVNVARNGAEEERDTRAPNDRRMNFIGAIRNEIEARRNYRDAFRGE